MRKLIFILFFTLLFSSFVSAALDDNIRGAWNLDGDTTDSAGTNDLTNNGAVYSSSGILDGNYDFDGTDYMDTSTPFFSGSGDRTIVLWYNKDDLTDDVLFSEASGVSGDMSMLIRGPISNKMRCQFQASTGWRSAIATTDTVLGNTYMFACVYSGNYLNVSVNGGAFEQETTMSGVAVQNWGNSELGRDSYDSNQQFNGKIYQLLTWDRALTELELAELYNAGAGYTYPFTVVTGWQGFFLGVENPASILGTDTDNIDSVLGVASS
jgi:hypothetical protein